MEFTLNIVYGGELNASKALSPFCAQYEENYKRYIYFI